MAVIGMALPYQVCNWPGNCHIPIPAPMRDFRGGGRLSRLRSTTSCEFNTHVPPSPTQLNSTRQLY